MKIQLPEKVSRIIRILTEHGFEAYAVGGCVRDSILGREPEDWDITTSAAPLQVKKLFRRTIDTGIQHGTVTVRMEKESFEVTTYRIDGEYEDSRHPKTVEFTKSLKEDLKRRDFTINAMAYNENTGLVDLFGGEEDLGRGVIRCVGDPLERFQEDALRMMRAVRFAAQLGFTIEEKTREGIRTLAPTLENISAERIQTELLKLMLSEHPEYWEIAYETGITAVVMPEFDEMMKTPQRNPYHCYNVGEHTLCALRHVPAERMLRLSVLLHDIGKPGTKTTDENGIDHFYKHGALGEEMARAFLKRLKFDNETVRTVSRLVRWHDQTLHTNERSVRRAMNRIGVDIFPALLQIRIADLMAQSDKEREERLQKVQRVYEFYQKILENGQCITVQDLAVNGSDLIAIGIPAGPRIGKVLSELLELVLEDPELNHREMLLKKAVEISEREKVSKQTDKI